MCIQPLYVISEKRGTTLCLVLKTKNVLKPLEKCVLCAGKIAWKTMVLLETHF